MSSNEVLIVSKRIIPAHQLATLMEKNDFYPRVDYGKDACAAKLAKYLSILVVDIDDPDVCGLEIARQFLAHSYSLAWFALCSGGNTPAMQQARPLMVGGFFFLSESGMALDSKRGAAQFLHGYRKTTLHRGLNISGQARHRSMIASFQPYYA